MAKYTEGFKRKAVEILNKLKEKGTLNIKDYEGDVIQVKNVRELVKALGVSSESLYKWVKLFSNEKSENKDDSDDFFEPEIESQIGKKSVGSGEKVIFNQRYYGWFAGMLGIKGYSNMLVPQLKLTIGNELIRQSGLIDMNKASGKLKKNGEGL